MKGLSVRAAMWVSLPVGALLMGAEQNQTPRAAAIIAHRGASHDAPGNTLAAVRRAVRQRLERGPHFQHVVDHF